MSEEIQELKKLKEEKRDGERFVKMVTPQYLGVYIVNRNTDSFRDIIGPNFFRDIVKNQTNKYSEAVSIYKEKYVKEDCWGTIEYVLDYNPEFDSK